MGHSKWSGVVARAMQAAQWVPLGYLGAVSVLGLLPTAPPPARRQDPRLVVLVPAHDEEHGIADTVVSLWGSSYPAARRRIVVIADNCTDATPELARGAGAEVWERKDDAEHAWGKAAALGWAVDRLLQDEDWDAVVFVDADSVAEDQFLSFIAARLANGASAVQGSYRVANPSESVISSLADASFAAQSVLRPRGRSRIGAAAKLQGNGMALARSVLEEHPWRSVAINDDVEYWFRLLRAGIHPVHEPNARVWSHMPATLSAARSQRDRWAAGQVELARRHAAGDLALAWRRRDPILAEAVISDLIFPPLAIQAALVCAAGLAAHLTGSRASRVAAAQAGVLAGHEAAALTVAKAPIRTWLSVLLAPAVIIWKLGIKARSLLRRGPVGWTRTPRAQRARES